MNGIIAAIIKWLAALFQKPAEDDYRTVPWGAKVSQTFRNRAAWIADDLGIELEHLMAVIAFESARTFRADIRNAAGSGAVGLIQFMPTTAIALGSTGQTLAAMTPEDQLLYVHRYLRPYRGRMGSIADLYMAILWPKAIGKSGDYVLFDGPSKTYTQNRGLDANQDGAVTKAEAAEPVVRELARGLEASNVWRGIVETEVRNA